MYKIISEIPTDYVLVTNSNDVADIKNLYGMEQEWADYDGMFVLFDDSGADYKDIYGFIGIIPRLDKPVYLLVHNGRAITK